MIEPVLFGRTLFADETETEVEETDHQIEVHDVEPDFPFPETSARRSSKPAQASKKRRFDGGGYEGDWDAGRDEDSGGGDDDDGSGLGSMDAVRAAQAKAASGSDSDAAKAAAAQLNAAGFDVPGSSPSGSASPTQGEKPLSLADFAAELNLNFPPIEVKPDEFPDFNKAVPLGWYCSHCQSNAVMKDGDICSSCLDAMSKDVVNEYSKTETKEDAPSYEDTGETTPLEYDEDNNVIGGGEPIFANVTRKYSRELSYVVYSDGTTELVATGEWVLTDEVWE